MAIASFPENITGKSQKKTVKPIVSVIIPSYNPGDLLVRCLVSIPTERTEVIVVDNGSKDGKVKEAEGNFPEVNFVYLGRNTGFAHACNRGAGQASGEILLFLNQDAEVVKKGFRKVLRFLRADEKRAIASGRVLYPDGRIQETVRRFPGYTSFIFGRRSFINKLLPGNRWGRHYLYQDMDFTRTQPVDICTGMFLMVMADAFDELEGFDEEFFFYVEDFDLCRRAKDRGWETWYVAETAAIHRIGENVPHLRRMYAKMHHYKGIYRYLVKHKQPGLLLKTFMWLGVGFAIITHLSLSRIK